MFALSASSSYYPIMDIYSLLMLSLILLLPSLLFFLKRSNGEGTRKLPPGPLKLPIIGNMHQLNGDLPHRSLQRLSGIYGPIMFLRLGSKPTLVVSSADMTKHIFQTHDIVFSDRPALYAARKLTYEGSDVAFAPYGDYWRVVRKVSVMELLSAKKVQSFRAVREEEVALMIASIGSSNGPVDMSETLIGLSNDIICRVAFGGKYDHKSRFHALRLETQELLGGFSVADFYPWLGWIHKIDGFDSRIKKNFEKLDEFYNKIIEEHLDPEKNTAEVEDFVDVMLRLQKNSAHKINIKAVLTDMFIAGTDTSAAALIWTMTELIKNPAIMKKAQEEVRAVVGSKTMVEESDLPRIHYLKLVMKESLRLHPPAPLLGPRETTEKCTIYKYEIPAKTRVFFNAKSIMTDAMSWENPEEFQPERFLDNPIDFKGQEFNFIPFGLGRRVCPGISFALNVIEIALANLLHRFNWELPQGIQRENLDMNEAFGLTMHKKIPLHLVASSFLCTDT